MNISGTRLFVLAQSLLVVFSTCAYADDTEIFTGSPTNVAAPNIMFVLDTSGSMGSNVTTTADYNPSQSYSGSGNCSGIGSRVYYSTTGAPPSCGSNNYFELSQLKCRDALSSSALGSGGSGFYVGSFVRWGGSNSNRSWRSNFSPNNAGDVECRADNGVDGNLSTTNPYPTNQSSNSPNGVWVSDVNNSYWATGTGITGTLYTGNYVAYWNQFRTVTIGTRMSIMKTAAVNLINSLSGVNVGLMRYSRNGGSGDQLASGGMVAYPISPIETNRTALVAAINSYSANGFTPLSETLYEAYRYFSGGQVLYGSNSVPFYSVDSSRDSSNTANYNSPADFSCQKNYIVYLTDGLPTADSEANSLITGLTDFSTLGGTCDATSPSSDWPDAGLCLVPLSRYLYKADMRTDVAGTQNVQTFWIGFGDDVAGGAPFEYLDRAAKAASESNTGTAYTAGDSASLAAVLTNIVTNILQTSTTFSSPAVAVNAFNRTRSLSDLYVSVFQPSNGRHWPGNLKKYRVKATEDGAVIVGQDASLPAIDETTGFFVNGVRSFWSTETDGPQVRKGGAANQLPDPTARNVYTYIGANPSSPTTLTAHPVSTSNSDITTALLNIGNSGDPTRDELINWARGQDVQDQYPFDPDPANGNTTEQRRMMGDPIHTQPALVIYGGTTSSPNVDDAVAYLPTNDGYLHAINAQTGVELWSFIPQEMLEQLKNLYLDQTPNAKNYLLDGEVRVLKFDANGDGIVTPSDGDRVFIYFGQGRGGSNYYALEVTDKTNPKFMWALGPTQLVGIGQAWSTPAVTRINISGATQNSQKLVLVIGGGYDTIEDNINFVNADSVGNHLYIIDALRGSVLWSAGSSGATFNHSRMTHSIPSSVSVLDTNSDGYGDRMYVGDMAAQVWRLDIMNGSTAANLVRGGVIASLGSKEEGTHTVPNTRRFYNQPDVAAVQRPGAGPFLNIAIGSGYRGHPLNTTIRDRLYSIRDYRPFTPMTQAEYDSLTIISDADLLDITTNMTPTISAGAYGWKLLLNQPGGNWVGEKSLGQATTLNNNIVFTTYTPNTGVSSDPCTPALGTNRAYAVSVLDGSPTHRPDGTVDPTDRYTDFNFGGIATDISTMVLETEPTPCTGPDCPQPCVGPNCPPTPPRPTQFVCLAGVRVLDVCRDFDSRIKTYWREVGAD